MSSLLQLFDGSVRPPHSQSFPGSTHLRNLDGRPGTPKVYPRIEAHDSSSIHAGDAYTTHYGDYHNHITTSNSVVLFGREVLEAPPENILSLVDELRSTTLRLEALQHQMRALEGFFGRNSQRADSSLLDVYRVQKARRNRGTHAKLPRGTTIHTSIKYIPPPPTVQHVSSVIFTMKIRFTITYLPTSASGAVNRWYEWEIDVVNPSHRRLLCSSPTGISVVNVARGNRFLPYCELYITLKDGWTWDDEQDSDEVTTELSCHDTKQEILDCLVGTRTIEKDFKVRQCSCFLCDKT